MTDPRPADLQRQAHEHAEKAREKMDDRRADASGGVSGWMAERTGDWSTDGPDEGTMQRQKFVWNALINYWFRMEMDGWENVPKQPVLLVGIHSGAPFVWDAWTVGVQWWRRFGEERPLLGTAHDVLMAAPLVGRYFRAMGVLPAAPTPSPPRSPRDATWRCGPAARSTRCGRGASATKPPWLVAPGS